MNKNFDLIVIGTGPAGHNTALICSKAEMSVAIIDKNPFGGTCALRGCEPSKMLNKCAEIIDCARKFLEKGIKFEKLEIDWQNLIAFIRNYVNSRPSKFEKIYSDEGIEFFKGTASFINQNTISVGDDQLSAKFILIATGTKPRQLAMPGHEFTLTSDEFMELKDLPERVLFIGGGYESFEFAHVVARADRQIKILEMSDKALKNFDQNMVDKLMKKNEELGIEFYPNTGVEAVEQKDNYFLVKAKKGEEYQEFIADIVINCSGVVPVFDNLNLEAANVQTIKDGIEVNEFLQSVSNPIVYAAGDVCTRGMRLAPIAAYEANVVATNILKGNQIKVDFTGMPSAVYTIPAIASVGLLESSAQKMGYDFHCKYTDLSDMYVAHRAQEYKAAAKVLVDNKNGQILGVHMIGYNVNEAINLFAFVMQNKMTFNDLKKFVSIFPSIFDEIKYMV